MSILLEIFQTSNLMVTVIIFKEISTLSKCNDINLQFATFNSQCFRSLMFLLEKEPLFITSTLLVCPNHLILLFFYLMRPEMITSTEVFIVKFMYLVKLFMFIVVCGIHVSQRFECFCSHFLISSLLSFFFTIPAVFSEAYKAHQ